jgi:hypothetical protein
MQMKILCGILAAIGISALCGCGPSGNKPTTAEEKKAFVGGPMPASARKEFEEGQKRSAEAMAALAAKAKAAAVAGNK